eukprot:186346-Amphidinium_carterae.2
MLHNTMATSPSFARNPCCNSIACEFLKILPLAPTRQLSRSYEEMKSGSSSAPSIRAPDEATRVRPSQKRMRTTIDVTMELQRKLNHSMSAPATGSTKWP